MSKVFFVVCFVVCLLSSCKPQNSFHSKINGLSFVASNDSIQQQHIKPILEMNANWVSIMPFAFMESLDDRDLHYNDSRQWFGERVEGVKQNIKMMHLNGIKVMLKPQIWIGRGEFTGYISMKNEKDWKMFEQNYRDMILLYAKLAQEIQVEMFCIGTELSNFVSKRPEFWRSLILSVKEVYSGELTYAENWDKIDKVPFWSDVDYIGVDAYFPVSEEKTSTLKGLKTSWQPILQNLEALSNTQNKPILFTEFGYRSINYAGKQPWDSSRIDGQYNETNQDILLKGLFENIWDRPWFAGGFLWKWFHNSNRHSNLQNNRFNVQNKKAESSVRNYYAKFK